jgi:hypothetical protein
MLQCTGCLHFYKTRAGLQAHQRKICKTFKRHKKSDRKHLDVHFTSSLLYFPANIADLISSYAREPSMDEVVQMLYSVLTDMEHTLHSIQNMSGHYILPTMRWIVDQLLNCLKRSCPKVLEHNSDIIHDHTRSWEEQRTQALNLCWQFLYQCRPKPTGYLLRNLRWYYRLLLNSSPVPYVLH